MVRKPKTTGSVQTVAVLVACVAIFAGIAVDRVLFHLPPGDPTDYHKRVKVAVFGWPKSIGNWVGEDDEIPRSAIKILHPNALLARNFTNLRTRETATVLIVHCQDSRDMGGHYPPVCYPANGWVLAKGTQKDWRVGKLDVKGMEYHFRTGELDRERSMWVANFIVHPSGTTERTIRGVRAVSEDPRLRGFGAGQVQVVLNDRIRPERRAEIVQELLDELATVIEAMMTGLPE